MSLQSRIDKAETIAQGRLKAEQKETIRALLDWVNTLSRREQVAFWRYVHRSTETEATSTALENLLDGQAEMTPEDEVLIDDILKRMPSELMEHLWSKSERASWKLAEAY